LHSGYLAWSTTKHPGTYSVQTKLRLRRLGATSSRTLDFFGADSFGWLGDVQISGRYVYWGGTLEYENELNRSTLSGSRWCDFSPEGREGLPAGTRVFAGTDVGADFAVDRGRLLYTDGSSVYRVDRDRERWSCS
jgi:hypothetical protein